MEYTKKFEGSIPFWSYADFTSKQKKKSTGTITVKNNTHHARGEFGSPYVVLTIEGQDILIAAHELEMATEAIKKMSQI